MKSQGSFTMPRQRECLGLKGIDPEHPGMSYLKGFSEILAH